MNRQIDTNAYYLHTGTHTVIYQDRFKQENEFKFIT